MKSHRFKSDKLGRLAPMSRNQGIRFDSNGLGALCHYCRRPLEAKGSGGELAAVVEHYKPRRLGGGFRVWACAKCDLLKGGKTHHQWERFMQEYPMWWTWRIKW